MRHCLFLFSFVAVIPPAYADQPKKYNVLFMAVDDLNDWVGCLGGHRGAKTPHIDKLAQRGTVFTHAYCNAPLCNPSRASLMSGLRPSTTGVYGNRHDPRKIIAPNIVSLQELFRRLGYYVAGCGKIYHGRFHNTQGWDAYSLRGLPPKAIRPKKAGKNPDLVNYPLRFGPVDTPEENLGDTRLARWAADQIGKKHEKPFFLAVGFRRPHMPWHAPRKYFKQHPLKNLFIPPLRNDDLDDIPPIGRIFANPGIGFGGPKNGDHPEMMRLKLRPRAIQAYLATCTYADACVGIVLDALANSPYADNTIIILWGDHGWHLGEKLHWRKHALWEEATRTPLMIVAPKTGRPKTRCDRIVTLLDVYPTLVDLCKLPQPKHLEGRSLVPLLQNPKAKWDHPAVTTYGHQNHAVRTEQWRYIRYSDGSEELYDHKKDPHEWKNLAKMEKYAPVKTELAKWLPKINVPDRVEASEFRQIEKLLKAMKK